MQQCNSKTRFTTYFDLQIQMTEEITKPDLAEKSNIKVLYWETNFNNKLGCTAMIHIDLAPRNAPTLGQMDSYIFEIRTKDESHPPVLYKLTGLLLFPFEQICWQQSYPSHGMSTMELADFFFERYSTKFKWSTHVAVYFYLKYNDVLPH